MFSWTDLRRSEKNVSVLDRTKIAKEEFIPFLVVPPDGWTAAGLVDIPDLYVFHGLHPK